MTSLEFSLDPAAAQRLARHPAIATARIGRGRSTAEEWIWLDTAEGGLAAEGLAVAAPKRGPLRLLRGMPPADRAWIPGTPAEWLDGAPPDPAGLVPVAAFSGRRSLLQLGDVEAELLLGTLRAVAAEVPVARLRLSGPVEAVLARAAALASDLHLLPPTASLAETGRALARGEPPRPRRSGPPTLAGTGSVEAALLAGLGHLLEAMLVQTPGCRLGAGPEGVHQTRVAVRRLRSILKAFGPAVDCAELAELQAALKALAGALGPARDWDVFLAETGADAAAAIGADRRLAALLRAATAQRQAAYATLERVLEGPALPRLVLAGLGLLLRRPWREAATEGRQALLDQPLAEFAGGLLGRRWRRLRRRGAAIDGQDAAALHELRLEAKRLRYAAELFVPLWPDKPARRFLRRLAALQEALGQVNDTAVARGLVTALGPGVAGWAVGAVEGFAAGRASQARRRALKAWARLRAADPFWR